MKVLKGIGIFIGVILVLIGLSYVFGYNDVLWTKTVGKAKQNAETEVFYQTDAYIGGKIQEATKYRLEYLKATDDTSRKAIQSVVVHTMAEVDMNKLPYDLRTFVQAMKDNQPYTVK